MAEQNNNTSSTSAKSNPLSFFNPVLGSALDFGVNYALSNFAANRQLGNSRKMFDYTFGQQNQRQDFLNANAATIEKQSLKNAGLSAATLNATPFSGNVGSGTGISGTDAIPQMNLFSQMLQMKQLEIQDKLADADVALKGAEANKIEKEIPWIDKINEVNVSVQKSIEALNLGTDRRANETYKHEIDKLLADIDLTNEQKSYQHYSNLAMEQTYNYNGKEVKGYEIPNFRELVDLSIAEKTLEVAKYNAKTERMSVEGSWDKFLVNEFLRPIMHRIKTKYKNEGIWSTIWDTFLDLLSGDIFSDEGSTEVGGQPVE